MSYSKLWEACEKGSIKDVIDTIKLVDNINKYNSQGWNAIILAAFNQHVEITEILLKNGADVNSANPKGTTVFMYAKTKVLENNNYFFLDFLLESGANINQRDKKNNWTVLDYAKQLNNIKLINYLKNKRAE